MNRNNNQLLTQVLEHTKSKISVSGLIRNTGTNHSRIKIILCRLLDTDLIVRFERDFVITNKGRVYLENWKKFYDFSQTFGLEL